MGVLTQAIGLIASLSILVFIHELGHFLFARLFKTRVEKFYLFFNPWFSIFKIKKGETEYGIGWLPLGGYVKISGMIDESLDTEQLKQAAQPHEFRSKPTWQRLLIMIGGVLVNFIAAMLIYILLMYFTGKEYIPMSNIPNGLVWDSLALKQGFQNGDKVIKVGDKEITDFGMISESIVFDSPEKVTVERNGKLIDIVIPEDFTKQIIKEKAMPLVLPAVPFEIDSVIAGNNAEKAGLLKNDKILSVNNIETPYSIDVMKNISLNKDKNIAIVVERLGLKDTIMVEVNKEGKIGIAQKPITNYIKIEKENYGLLASIPAGISEGMSILKNYIRQMKFVFSKEGVKNLGGFGAIGSIFPKSWDWVEFWNKTAFLSIILAFMNILPIPALDGGHVLFLTFEMITGRKPSDKFLEYATITGMVLLLTLLLVANGNDVIRMINNFIK